MNHDTCTTHLLRTPTDVLSAVRDLLSIGMPNIEWYLEHTPGSDPSDPANLFGVIHAGPWDARRIFLCREQVDHAIANA